MPHSDTYQWHLITLTILESNSSLILSAIVLMEAKEAIKSWNITQTIRKFLHISMKLVLGNTMSIQPLGSSNYCKSIKMVLVSTSDQKDIAKCRVWTSAQWCLNLKGLTFCLWTLINLCSRILIPHISVLPKEKTCLKLMKIPYQCHVVI